MKITFHPLVLFSRGFSFAALSLAIIAPTQVGAEASDEYEGGRGLITLDGPSGLFLNPTSGTLPERASTIQYCVFFPDNRNDVVGHGVLAAYGFTDEFEFGGIATLLDFDGGDPSERGAGGPFARYRFTKDDGFIPQISLGASARVGDTLLNKYSVFVASYKRIPIDEDGILRSIGFHGGLKELFFDSDRPEEDSFSVYGGIEVQFPLRLYAVGEVQTKDTDINEHVPYSFGAQWRAPGIAMSIAGIQNGGTSDISFYYGIGGSLTF